MTMDGSGHSLFSRRPWVRSVPSSQHRLWLTRALLLRDFAWSTNKHGTCKAHNTNYAWAIETGWREVGRANGKKERQCGLMQADMHRKNKCVFYAGCLEQWHWLKQHNLAFKMLFELNLTSGLRCCTPASNCLPLVRRAPGTSPGSACRRMDLRAVHPLLLDCTLKNTTSATTYDRQRHMQSARMSNVFDVLCRIYSAFVLCHGKRPADFALFGTINCCCCCCGPIETDYYAENVWFHHQILQCTHTHTATTSPPITMDSIPVCLSVQLDMNHFTKVHFIRCRKSSMADSKCVGAPSETLLGGTVDSFLLASLAKYWAAWNTRLIRWMHSLGHLCYKYRALSE